MQAVTRRRSAKGSKARKVAKDVLLPVFGPEFVSCVISILHLCFVTIILTRCYCIVSLFCLKMFILRPKPKQNKTTLLITSSVCFEKCSSKFSKHDIRMRLHTQYLLVGLIQCWIRGFVDSKTFNL